MAYDKKKHKKKQSIESMLDKRKIIDADTSFLTLGPKPIIIIPQIIHPGILRNKSKYVNYHFI